MTQHKPTSDNDDKCPERRLHYLSLNLAKIFGHNSFVLWSKEVPKGAVVFIHGFNGSPYSTFSKFDEYIPRREEFKYFDVYFFGYDSVFKPLSNSANRFYDFLDQIDNNNHELFRSTMGCDLRHWNINYSKILVVAHSMGAVVSRLAALNGHTMRKTWPAKMQFVLFAPAHLGARDSLEALAAGAPGYLGLAAVGARHYIVPFNELVKPNAGEMLRLRTETDKLIKNDKISSFTVAKIVIDADYERIVNTGTFCEDPAYSPRIPNSDHLSVCKPQKCEDPILMHVIDFLR